MEHLKATFHQALADPAEELVRVEEGQVHIYEGRWAPHDLLEMGSEAYEKEFRNWLANYREQLLERGRELLEEFDQEERFNKLKEIYKKDSVVPFVGAGMSMPSNYPSWTGFLKSFGPGQRLRKPRSKRCSIEATTKKPRRRWLMRSDRLASMSKWKTLSGQTVQLTALFSYYPNLQAVCHHDQF